MIFHLGHLRPEKAGGGVLEGAFSPPLPSLPLLSLGTQGMRTNEGFREDGIGNLRS